MNSILREKENEAEKKRRKKKKKNPSHPEEHLVGEDMEVFKHQPVFDLKSSSDVTDPVYTQL